MSEKDVFLPEKHIYLHNLKKLYLSMTKEDWWKIYLTVLYFILVRIFNSWNLLKMQILGYSMYLTSLEKSVKLHEIHWNDGEKACLLSGW